MSKEVEQALCLIGQLSSILNELSEKELYELSKKVDETGKSKGNTKWRLTGNVSQREENFSTGWREISVDKKFFLTYEFHKGR